MSAARAISKGKGTPGDSPGVDVMARRRALADLIALVTDSAHAANTRRAYQRSLEAFFEWYGEQKSQPFTKALAQSYLQTLIRAKKSPPTVNQSLTVLRKLAHEAADNGLLDPSVAAAIDNIKAVKRLGRRTGRWLSVNKASQLVHAPDLKTLKGKRDRVLLGLLLECGLRRDEATMLDVSQFQMREGRYIFADVKGKGGRIRTVPIPHSCALRIEDWIKAAGIEDGRLLRSLDRGGHVAGEDLSAAGIYKTVAEYAAAIGVKIAPHDLRRTFAKLAHGKQARVDQIKEALGHSSIKTTEIYLGIDLDLQNAACDVLDLDGNETENE